MLELLQELHDTSQLLIAGEGYGELASTLGITSEGDLGRQHLRELSLA